MPPYRTSRSRTSSPSPQAPGPSRSTKPRNTLKRTPTSLGKLASAAKSLLEITKTIDKTEQNHHALQDLDTHLRRLQDSIVAPILARHPKGISPALETRIDQLANDLLALTSDWHQSTTHNDSNHDINYGNTAQAIYGLNRKINDSLEAFLLENQVSAGMAIDEVQQIVEKHMIDKEIRDLPHANAAYDDYSRNNAPSCFEGTRQGVLEDFKNWFFSRTTFMYVLLGIAGVGKSTIAQTIAALVASDSRLAASFFFSRYEDERSTAKTFFPTLAFQLAQHSEDFATRISKALQATPDAAQKSLALQLQILIIEPLKDVASTTPPMLVVIDALDECEEDGAAEILRLVLTQLVRLPFIKVFLTTRPESHLKPAIEKAQTRNGLVLHDIEASVVTGDIRRFLEYELSPAKVERHMPGCGWTCMPEDLDALVLAAGQLFIVASTSERFIKNKRVGDPELQLRRLLKSFEAPSSSGTSPFTKLDALYLQILESAIPSNDPDELLTERFQDVVGAIITLQNPLLPETLACLLDQSANYVKATLRPLQSVIVSSDRDPRPHVYHPSFPDFITNSTRCKEERFLIETPKHHARLAGSCLDLMDRQLKRNICNLAITDQYLENKDMPDLSTKIKAHISPELEYACLHWAVHLNKSMTHCADLVGKLERFASNHLLFWLEVLSLIGRMDVAYQAITHASKLAVDHNAPRDLRMMLNDAHRLIMGSHDIIKLSAFHVYYSALPFIPRETMLWRKYEKEAKGSVRIGMGRDRELDLLLVVLSGHTGGVNSIALSPNGSRLASASSDNTVRVWDAISGASIAVMNGHSDSVISVVFSPDGTHLASASNDKTVRVWDAASGAEVAVMNGHSHPTTSVVFSPKGALLASASSDKTVRVWDAASGAEVAVMNGHSDCVWSVVFSPDGTSLASASKDETVRVWDAVSGASITIMNGHSNSVASVVFSPDGTRLASASADNTVRVWDAASGAEVAVMNGHWYKVWSVVFSPDGTRLASASNDKTVRLWDAVSGAQVAVMKGHSDWVRSVIFSPDGTRLASASNDKTVRVWDAVTGESVAVMNGHSHSVTSVVFSPDGTRLASASNDKTVRVWDAVSGVSVAVINGYSDSVTSLVFSPEGTRVASASEDDTDTVRVWDAVSGAEVTVVNGYLVVFSPDGTHFVSASGDDSNNVRVWDAVSGAQVAVMNGHSDWVTSVVFSPGGTRLASASDDKTVRVWDAVSGASVVVINGHSDSVFSVVFSPDGTRLASASSDKTVRVWDAVTGASLTVSPINGNDVKPPVYPHAAWYQGTLIFAAEPSPYISQPNNPSHIFGDSSVTTQQNIQENSSNLFHTTPTPTHHPRSKTLLFSHHERSQSYVISHSSNRATELPTNTVLCWLPSKFRQVEYTWSGSTLALLQDRHLTLLDTASLQLE